MVFAFEHEQSQALLLLQHLQADAQHVHKYLTREPNAKMGKAISKKSRNITKRAISSRGNDIAQMPAATATRTINAMNNL
jgi:hypothetical protein